MYFSWNSPLPSSTMKLNVPSSQNNQLISKAIILPIISQRITFYHWHNTTAPHHSIRNSVGGGYHQQAPQKIGFAAESGQIRKIDRFKPLRFESLYQPYFSFCLFAWSRCGRIVKKVSEKIPGTMITRYYLRRHLHRVMYSRRYLSPQPPITFESKLILSRLKET